MDDRLTPTKSGKYQSQGLSPIHMSTVVSAFAPSSPPPSPSSFFHKRYTVTVNPADAEGSFDAIDKLSRVPKNQRVIIFVFDDQSEFDRVVAAYRKLRSRFVANLLDQFEDGGRFYIVVERGSLLFDEYVTVKGLQTITQEDRKAVLRDVVLCWLFLYDQKFMWQLEPFTLMQFGPNWKVVDLRSVLPITALVQPLPNPLACDSETSAAIIERVFSYFHVELTPEYRNLGMILLELFMMNPILDNMTPERLYQLVQLEESQMQQALGPAGTQEDLHVLLLLRLVLSDDPISEQTLHHALLRVTEVLNAQQRIQPRSPHSPSMKHISGPGFLPAIM